MIHYIIIILAVFCFAAQFAFTKIYEKAVSPSASTSLIMVAATSLAGALLYLIIGGFSVNSSPISLFWAAFLAAIMIPYYLLSIKVLSLGSLAIYSMFMMLGGMLVPFFYGVLFLDEKLTLGRAAGAILLSFFIILQGFCTKDPQKGAPKGKKGLFFLFCLLIFLINGLTGVIAKAHEISKGAVDEISFTILSCLFTAALSLLILLFSKEKIRPAIKKTMRIRPLAIMILLGFAAYTGNFLHLKAASFVPASVQFPLCSGGVIILSALTSRFIFKEKISAKEWISVAGAFVSTFLFAF